MSVPVRFAVGSAILVAILIFLLSRLGDDPGSGVVGNVGQGGVELGGEWDGNGIKSPRPVANGERAKVPTFDPVEPALPESAGERMGHSYGISPERMSQIYEAIDSALTATGTRRLVAEQLFAKSVTGAGKAGAEMRLGRTLTDLQFLALVEIEAPYINDCELLGEIYLQDLDQALRGIWSSRQFSMEGPDANGLFRDSGPYESRMKFDGKVAVYYSLHPSDYPHLVQLLNEKDALFDEALAACSEFLSDE
jgi:hypothetical protein